MKNNRRVSSVSDVCQCEHPCLRTSQKLWTCWSFQKFKYFSVYINLCYRRFGRLCCFHPSVSLQSLLLDWKKQGFLAVFSRWIGFIRILFATVTEIFPEPCRPAERGDLGEQGRVFKPQHYVHFKWVILFAL